MTMKNSIQQSNPVPWLACSACIVFSAATIAAPAAPLPAANKTTSVTDKQCYTYDGERLPLRTKTTSVSEYVEHIRKNPRRKAAMDKAAQKIAGYLNLETKGVGIIALRTSKGFTQLELARNTGLQQSYLSRIENNRQSLRDETVTKLASALGVTDDEVRSAFKNHWKYLESKQA
ncbi:phage associated protein [Neisseria zoodegmatis]|uniref:Phage associated protein n=1 Tax=Neisseria zoodegmatis TaxID=326523 RepID=A0A378X8K8_9NEIS|nr:helix-turn-helix transcriptional regulator [Neisseria zoodegmatis]SUA48893.1 phage associated protein [Neisseria zoodegmatis]